MTHGTRWHSWWQTGAGVVLLLTALLALPVRRTEEEVA